MSLLPNPDLMGLSLSGRDGYHRLRYEDAKYLTNRRGMVDMRKRFRGNQPVAVSVEIEAGAGASGGGKQLYGGRPAVAEGVRETAGEDDGKEEG